MSYNFIKPEDITISDYVKGTTATNITEHELYMLGVHVNTLGKSPLVDDPDLRMTFMLLKGLYASLYKRRAREKAKEETESIEVFK